MAETKNLPEKVEQKSGQQGNNNNGRRRGQLLHLPTPAPVRAFNRARRAAEKIPFAGGALRQVRETEDWVIAELKHRMDSIGESAARAVDDANILGRATRQLGEMLETGWYSTADESRMRLYMRVLDNLLPEQACMFVEMAQRDFTAMCHIDAGPAPVGPAPRRVLAYANLAGRDAGLVLRDAVPILMSQMVTFGLVQEMPEQKKLKKEYEILQSDDSVRRTVEHIKTELHMSPRVQRRSLRLSRFGRDMWQDVGSKLKKHRPGRKPQQG